MSIESAALLFTKVGVVIPLPYNTGRVIAFINIQTKEINYMMSATFNDGFRFVRAAQISVLY